MTKYIYRQFLCGPHTVAERSYILYCSLFTTFIHCRHNSTVYAVSKQHKYHIKYSKYHWSELGNFPLQHNFHTQDCISQTVCKYISSHQFTFRCLMVGKIGRFTFNYLLSRKVPHMRILKGGTRGRELNYLCNICILGWLDLPAPMWLYNQTNN